MKKALIEGWNIGADGDFVLQYEKPAPFLTYTLSERCDEPLMSAKTNDYYDTTQNWATVEIAAKRTLPYTIRIENNKTYLDIEGLLPSADTAFEGNDTISPTFTGTAE